MQSRVVLAMLTTVILALPITASAQEATLTGQVTDATGAVLPGVVVRAIHEATGTTTEVVTDGRGGFRIPTRIGTHQITAELAGFTTVTRTGLSLSVGQEIVVNLQMSPSTVQETVTVTGEAPLVNPTSTRVSGVVNTRQIEELPLNGRNFFDLTLLARGQTANHTADTPTDSGNRFDYNLNIDGQQVTTQLFRRMNPTFSRDAIAEFEFVANRFDATQGRTHGAQLNVITKSGTNSLAGTFAGYFRDDRFNAADFIQQRVLPYSNQQISGTLGGPIIRNRAHFFGSYEYEREPQILTFDSPYPFFNLDSEEFAKTARKFLGRGDLEVTRQQHLSVRFAKSDVPKFLQGGGALLHPSAMNTMESHMHSTIGSLTQIFGNRAVNELKVGYSSAWDLADNTLTDPFTESLLPADVGGRSRIMCLRFLGGYQIGGCSPAPTGFTENVWTFRDQFTYSYQLGPGSHTLKTGGELLSVWTVQGSCGSCAGVMDLSGGPVPANLQELFPVWNDLSTWKRNAPELARIARQFEWITGELGPSIRRPDLGVWAQDDWTISPRLTLNLGVRYDVSFNKYRKRRGGSAVPAGRPEGRHEQCGPADRVCLQRERADRGSWRVGPLFRRPGQHHPDTEHPGGEHGAGGGGQRRAARLRRQSLQRSGADARSDSCTREGAQHHRPDQQCERQTSRTAIRRRLASSGRSGTRWRSRSTCCSTRRATTEAGAADRAIAVSSSSRSICRTTRPPGRTIRSPMSPAGRIPAGARSGS